MTMTLLTDDIYVGGVDDLESIDAYGINAVISLVPIAPLSIPHLQITTDFWHALMRRHKEIFDFIDQHRPIFIHCQWGQQRSPSLVLAYLMYRKNFDYDAALKATGLENKAFFLPLKELKLVDENTTS